MKRIVVHIGGQRTAPISIPKGLFANVDVLAENGVLVPKTGRHELTPLAVRHHLLPWSFDPVGDHPYDPDVWDTLGAEISASEAHTVLLSSELLAGVAANEQTATLLGERLHALSDDVTMLFLAREQLGLLNSLYGARLKALEITCDFDTYLAESPDLGVYDLAGSFRRWYDAGDTRFLAMPWEPDSGADELAALLALADIELRAGALLPVESEPADDLGPVGVEATRLLGTYLRGQFPDFRFGEPAARRLRRRAAAAAQANGWCSDDFWGWSAEQAASAAARYGPSNQEFAERVWGSGWTLPAPVERAQNIAELVELDPLTVNRVHRYLIETASTFGRLRTKESAS